MTGSTDVCPWTVTAICLASAIRIAHCADISGKPYCQLTRSWKLYSSLCRRSSKPVKSAAGSSLPTASGCTAQSTVQSRLEGSRPQPESDDTGNAENRNSRPVTILAFESLAPQGFSEAVLMWGKVLPMKAVFRLFMVTPTGTNTIIHEHTLNLNLWRKIAYEKNTIR